jgi:hypothetical protein
MPTLAGPCSLTYQGRTLTSRGDVTVTETTTPFTISNGLSGTIGARAAGYEHRVSLELDGRILADDLPVLYELLTLRLGTRLFSDRTLVISTVDGQRRTYHNARLTTMPSMTLSSNAQPLGRIEFTAIHKSDMAITAANSLYTDSTAAWVDPVYDTDSIITASYDCSWGSTAPWDSFYGLQGARLEFGSRLEAERDDRRGVVDYQLSDLTARASLIPVGPTPAQVSTALLHQGAGAALGRDLSGTDPLDLTLSTTGLHVTLYAASPLTATQLHSFSRRRQGEVTWAAGRRTIAGVLTPPARVSTAAPE